MQVTIPNPINWFRHKTKIFCVFKDETNNIFIKKMRYANKTIQANFGGKKQTYLVDKDLVYFYPKKKLGISFYSVGIPQPIDMSNPKASIDSTSLNDILESKVIQELFSSDTVKMLRIILYVLIGNICLSGILLAKLMGAF